MKKNLFILSAIAVTAAALVSCEKEQDVNIKEEHQGVPFEIIAGTIETKTANDGMSTNWVAGDQINLFHAVSGESTYINDGAFSASADGASVSFTGTLASVPSSGKYNWYAVYPYDSGFDTPAGTAEIIIPDAMTQTGNNSTAHLAGLNCPVAGSQKSVDFDATPVIELKHLTAIVKVHVTNKTASPITVSGVSFTAPININGNFKLDLTVDPPALSGVGISNTTNLTVSGAEAIAADGSADYYLSIKYFAISAGQEITLSVSTDVGNQFLTAIMPSAYTFAAGKIATLNFNFTNKAVNLAQFKYEDSDWLEAQSITLPAGGGDTDLTGTTQTVAPITLSSTNGGTTTRVHGTDGTPVTYDLRVYKNGGSFTLDSGDDYIITRVIMFGSSIGGDSVVPDCGTYDKSKTTWTGFTQNVKFTNNNGDRFIIRSINVFYQAATDSDHILIVPVTAYDAAYDDTYTDVSFKKLNVSDIVVTKDDIEVAGVTFPDATTVRIPYTANSTTSPRDLVFHIKSTTAGVDETVTVTQAGMPSAVNISTLTNGQTGFTVEGQVKALTSNKGYIIEDASGAVFVYTGAAPTVSLGQTVTVGGTVAVFNKGLQITSPDVTPGATGSPSYDTPTSYGLTEVTAWNEDGDNRLAQYVTLTGVAKSSYDFIVGGGASANATTYYAAAGVGSMSAGDYVTVTGYAINVMTSPARLGIVPTSITKDDTKPALIFNDIVDVAGAGVDDVDHALTPYRVTGWTPSLQSKPDWVTSVTPAPDCSKITYTVGTGAATARTGNIVIRLTKDTEHYDYTIKISQLPNISTSTVTVTMSTYASTHSWTTSAGTEVTPYTSVTLDSNITMTCNSSGNNGSYWSDGWRIYESESGAVTITAGDGYKLYSVKFTYGKSNNGVLKNGEDSVNSNDVVSTTAKSITLSVNHSSGTKKGQVKITAVQVVYQPE